MEVDNGSDVPIAWTIAESDIPIDKSVADIFQGHVANNPSGLAVSWNNEAWSYDALNIEANRVARLLRSSPYGVTKGQRVAFFMEQSVFPILAALAIVKAGGIYVPLDTSFPNNHVSYVLQDAGVKVLIHDDTTCERVMEFANDFDGKTLDLDLDLEKIAEQSPEDLDDVDLCGDSGFQVIYTSGSTGNPKGIELLHKGLIRLSMNTNWINITSATRYASMANYAFDASSFEIWSTLLNGGTIVVLPRSFVFTPRALKNFLVEQEITMMFITTQLFHFVARELPDAFSSLDQVVVGGEALSPEHAREVLEAGPPKRLTNGYGPAENTCCTTYHDVKLEDLKGGAAVPIGVPTSNSEVLLLDKDLQPVKVGEIGEIFCGGHGLASGYVNLPDMTAEKFLTHPMSDDRRIYRSGDWARWSKNRVLFFEGRHDRQVKIRGFRIELTGIETKIRKRDELVRDVAVVVREATSGHRRIVAYCVPSDSEVLGDLYRIRTVCAQLRTYLEREMPSYMIPSAIILVPDLPITPNGKLNLDALPTVEEILGRDISAMYPPLTATERRVAEIWCALLNLEAVSIHTQFQDLGGDSLNAAQLLILCEKAFSVKCPVYEFFSLPTVANLSRIIDFLKGRGEQSDQTGGKEDFIDLRKFVKLDVSIQPTTSYEFSKPTVVVLTGATGFLGAYLLREILRDSSVEAVHAIVRAKSQEEGLQRIRSNLQSYGIWDNSFASRMHCCLGDFSMPMMGLDPALYKELLDSVDTVIHNGAKIDYTAPYSSHAGPNVNGTIEVIKFCFGGKPKALHFLSTLAVFGPVGFVHGIADIYEDQNMISSIDALQVDMGYAQSKWVAEQVLLLAQKRGLAVSIYRPGFIICDGISGVSNNSDFMVRLTRTCISMGYFPLLHDQSKEFLTVDWASAAIFALAKRNDQLNKIFHLCRPDVKKFPSIIDYFHMLSYHGYHLKGIEFRDWVDILLRETMQVPSHPMLPLMPMMSEIVKDDQTRWEVYKGMPAVHCSNTTAGLEGTGIEFTAFDDPLMEKYLAKLQQQNLIPVAEPTVIDSESRATKRLTRMNSRLNRVASFRASGRPLSNLSAYLSDAGSQRSNRSIDLGSSVRFGRSSNVPQTSLNRFASEGGSTTAVMRLESRLLSRDRGSSRFLMGPREASI